MKESMGEKVMLDLLLLNAQGLLCSDAILGQFNNGCKIRNEVAGSDIFHTQADSIQTII